MKMTPYLKGGGSVIDSPWGSNQSKACDNADANTVQDYLAQFGLTFEMLLNADAAHSGRAEPLEFCVKDLMVKSGNQLSLQKHQGREEFWVVKKGVLTVVADGQRLDVNEGQAIFIPKGSVHCMNNRTAEPIEVEELQVGICREEDNVRLVDSSVPRRPTYPITTENEFKSAIKFAELQEEICQKFGTDNHPHPSLLNLSAQKNAS